jgi:hypothetical protein
MSGVKTRLLFICLGLLILVFPACKEKQENPVSRYGDTLINSYTGTQGADDRANLDALKTAISNYHAANEGYPRSLEDVGKLLNTQIDLTKYDYDPATGAVTLKPKQ